MEAIISKPKLLLLETRPQFLLLEPAVFFVGIGLALFHGYFNFIHMVLALIGAIFMNASVNVLNDYTDYCRGTDQITTRTPFSGGSGLLPSGKLTAKEALYLGIALLFSGVLIGCYFIFIYPAIAVVVVLGAILVATYTPLLTKAYITELFPGIGIGPLMVIGAYITQLPAGKVVVPIDVFMASIPVGLLVTNLLWINELPDYEADEKTGRRHGVLLLGKKNSAYAYVIILALSYSSIIASVAFNVLTPYALAGFLTLPIAIKASRGALKHYNDIPKLIPVLGQNILVVLVTPVLMGIGIIIGSLV